MRIRALALLTCCFAAACKDGPVNDDSATTDDSSSDDSATDDSATDDSSASTDYTSVRIDPETLALYRYERVDLALIGTKEDGSEVELTGEATWASADENVAFVTPEGQLEGRGAGSVTITATYGDLSDQLAVDVTAFNLTGTVTLQGRPVANVQVDVQGPVDSSTFLTSEVDGLLRLDGLGVGTYTLTATLDGNRLDPVAYTLTLPDDAALSPEIQVYSTDYPTDVDHYEPDDDVSQATLFAVGGPLQKHTLWTYGDEDWVSLNLLAGTEFEIYTTNLCYTCDTVITLYDVDGTTMLDSNDDFYSGLDSRIVFTPSANGNYFLRIRAYDHGAGVVSYFLGAGPNVDNDGDGFGGITDCDDQSTNVHGWAREVAGDAIDNNCDGYSAPASSTLDADEGSNDDVGGAIEMLELWDGAYWEPLHQGYWVRTYARTLHNETDVDWFRVSIPGYGEVQLLSNADSEPVRWTVWSADQSYQWSETVGSLDTVVFNEDSAPMDVYVQVDGANGEGAWYAFYALDYGLDTDEDGYYTKDWSDERDCDDSDPVSRNECYN